MGHVDVDHFLLDLDRSVQRSRMFLKYVRGGLISSQ